MKNSEKLQLEAEDKERMAVKSQEEIDLRAGQIDKLNQEVAFYTGELEKYRREQQDLLARADQEEQEEERKEKAQQRQTAIHIAQAIGNNDNNQ